MSRGEKNNNKDKGQKGERAAKTSNNCPINSRTFFGFDEQSRTGDSVVIFIRL